MQNLLTVFTPPTPHRRLGPEGGAGDLPPESGASLPRLLRPWFIMLLLAQVILIVVRWRTGDVHGALLMFVVFAVGVLAATVDSSGIDTVYGGYFGLMALVSGLLDFNLAIERIAWGQWRHRALSKGDLASLVKPMLFLVCASTQLVAAFLAYVLYKEAEMYEDMEFEAPLFATHEQARIYNAVLSHSERRLQAHESPKLKPFVGLAQKLP
mmetsp:Transcript_29175/g.51012  ORF Transcript_29175/g.51012 Transcript_29175/m.51012 type:complete len:211 (-) Transcript_29175:38-670(-)